MEPRTRRHDVTTLSIEGMHCGGCASSIEKSLSRVPGVSSVKADVESKLVEVGGSPTTADLLAAAELAGYRAQLAPKSDTHPTARAKSGCCCG